MTPKLNNESLEQRLARLSPEKRRILDQFLREKAQAGAAAASARPAPVRIPRRRSNDDLPLSFAQQRIWFLDQFAPGSSYYNVDNALRILFPLNVNALERSYNEVVRRHESLRTTFRSVRGKPIQVIADSLYLPMELRDLQQLPFEQRELEALRIATEEAKRPFDLEHGPLVRTMLVQLAPADYVLLLSMHHIISDGWSMNLFASEISKLYTAFCLGQPSPLVPLPLQYADFALWQRSFLQGDTLANQLDYWKKQLAGLELLQLPTDHVRPAVMSYRGARLPITIPDALYQKLNRYSQQEGVTLFMTMLAAFQTLLHRYTGQDDIAIGVPIANRNHPELETLIGFFVNTLVIRGDISGDPAFSQLLARVRNTALAAYAHEDFPFEKLVEEFDTQRDLSRNPLFQVCFQLFNVNDISETLFQPLTVATGISKFDLRLDLLAGARRLTGFIEYSTDLFEPATIERMARHYLTLLQSIVANPELRISQLPLLDAGEQLQILVEWNATKSDYPLKSLHEVFEKQAEATPGAIALRFENEQLTYGELNRKANQLAHYLQRRGVTNDVPVAVSLPRSVDMIVANLAILKAGGAYVPLDREYPAERRAFILADSGACLLLTDESQDDFATSDVAIVNLNDNLVADASHENLRSNVHPDNLAYVMYTSGSTGRPKGIAISQRAVVRLVCNTNYITLGPDDCVALASNASFDASTFEIWGALLNGARLVGVSKETLLAPQELQETLQREKITTLFLTTDLFNQLVAQVPALFSGLRTLFFGGSVVNPESVQNILKHGPPQRLVHVYGPTESTTFASFHEVRAHGVVEETIPIGRPLANTQLYILDKYGNPTPIGVPGELYIGGDGLARCYLNAPELTAASFIPNPFATDRPSRLYKTGDEAKYHSDGAIEFRGRRDRQVKVRGFRIELDEIESVLRAHPFVEEAAVIARQEAHGEKRLTAYVVPRDASKASTNGDSTDLVSQWKTVYDNVLYDGISNETLVDPTFNIAGWNSSYTGLPIPPVEMQEQVDGTVQRILRLRPSRVLELGCGTGLLLFRIAKHCASYTATDFSPVALEYVSKVLEDSPLPQVRLLQQNADDFSNLEQAFYDVIILNSIVQYFPNLDYLVRVLEGAVKFLKPGGAIFLGDVRNHALLEAFHASLETHRAPDSLSTGEFRNRVKESMADEQELTIHPAFFSALQRQLPQIKHVQVEPKRGRHLNELTRFRYDALLSTEEIAGNASPVSIEWTQLTELGKLLQSTDHDLLLVDNIPDSRVATAVQAVELLAAVDEPRTVGELTARLNSDGPTPEDLWTLAAETPFDAGVTWSSKSAGRLRAVFRRRSSPEAAPLLPFLSLDAASDKPLQSLGNQPVYRDRKQRFLPLVRSYLDERLPSYMIPASFVVLDSLPLTPNGKVDLKALAPPESTTSNSRRSDAQPSTPIEAALVRIWKQVLGLEHVGVRDNFFQVGGDSILSIQVVARARQAGIEITPKQFFQHQTIAELAAMVSTASTSDAGQLEVSGVVPLTPIQKWFFEQELEDPNHYNQAVLLQVPAAVDEETLRRAFRHVLSHHDALRLRFTRGDTEWQQSFVPLDNDLPFAVHDLITLSDSRQSEAIEEFCARTQGTLNLSSGPLLRMVLFNLGPNKPSRLLTVVHHLVIDGVSWRIFNEDLWTAYAQLSRGEAVDLPRKTASFQQWSQHLAAQAQTPTIKAEETYWLNVAGRQAPKLPRDFNATENLTGQTDTVVVSLTVNETEALLHEVPKAYQTQINDVLLAALFEAFGKWTGSSELLLDLEGHGREPLSGDIDVSRTVGWFTSIFPVLLRTDSSASEGELLKSIKEQLRSIPNRGIGYGLLRYLSGDPELERRLSVQEPSEVSFNYLGQLSSAPANGDNSGLAVESSGRPRSPRQKRRYLLEINASVIAGRLEIHWTFANSIHRQTTTDNLAQAFLHSLRSLIAHCLSANAGGYTPSDFSKARLNQASLDRLVARVKKSREKGAS